MNHRETGDGTVTEWKCLAGGDPEFGYSASTVVNGRHIVGKTTPTLPEALEDLRLKTETALEESGKPQNVRMVPLGAPRR